MEPLDRFSEFALPDTALPMEYRYKTWMAACLYGGAALLAWLLFFTAGPLSVLLALVSLVGVGIGLMGLFADPAGFMHAVGKKLVVTDGVLEEVDENARVLWQVRPAEIAGIHTANCRTVFPGTRTDGWRAEVWVLTLHDGSAIRIPLWLLPNRGERLKERLTELMRVGGARQAVRASN
jgi:hypothetical protein